MILLKNFKHHPKEKNVYIEDLPKIKMDFADFGKPFGDEEEILQKYRQELEEMKKERQR